MAVEGVSTACPWCIDRGSPTPRPIKVENLRAEKAAQWIKTLLTELGDPLEVCPLSSQNVSPSSHQNKCNKQTNKHLCGSLQGERWDSMCPALSLLTDRSDQHNPLLMGQVLPTLVPTVPPKYIGKDRGEQTRITDTSRQHSGSDPNTLFYSNRVKLVNGNLSPTEGPPARPCLPPVWVGPRPPETSALPPVPGALWHL